ncbi:hypothetical protein GCM10027418_14370 [Mariniluteicoccus endophyticus]
MSTISQSLDALSEAVRTATEPQKVPPTRPDVTVTGASPTPGVSVRITRGRVSAVDLRDSVLDRDPADIGGLVAEAVNAALDAYDAAVVAHLKAQEQTDTNKLARELEQIGTQAQRTLDEYLWTMQNMLRRASDEANG